jgi:hypothetical protein
MIDDELSKLESALATIEGPDPGAVFVARVMTSVVAGPTAVPSVRPGRAFAPMFLMAIGAVLAVSAESLGGLFGGLPADGLIPTLGFSLVAAGSTLMPPALMLLGVGAIWFVSGVGGAGHARLQPSTH